MPMKAYLAADFGASGGKMAAARFDGQRLLLEDYRSFPNRAVQLGETLYWDLFSIYESILSGAEAYRAEGVEAESLGIDAWGATYGLLNRQGRLLEPVYHYRDARTEAVMEPLFRHVPAREVFQLTGCQCNRTYTLPQLYSCVLSGDPCLEHADALLFLPDLIGYFLTGVATNEMTIAGTSALLGPQQEDWSLEVFRRFGIPTHFLRPLVDAGSVKGTIQGHAARRIGNGVKLVATTSHDSAAAVAAIPGFGAGKLYISIGTNVSMGVELDEPITTGQAFAGGFKNTGGFGRKKIIYRDFSAFWIINELRAGWEADGMDTSFDRLHELAVQAKSVGAYVDPEYAPINNPGGDMTRKLTEYLERTGQPIPETVGEWVRCVFESVALKAKHVAERIHSDLGVPLSEACVINGGSRNTLLVQLIADALGLPVKAGMPYATLAGNLLTQLFADGCVASLTEMRQVAARSFQMKEYAPVSGTQWDEALSAMRERDDWK